MEDRLAYRAKMQKRTLHNLSDNRAIPYVQPNSNLVSDTHVESKRLLAPVSTVVDVQFFVVGHDCGHRAFSKNKLVEDIVGTLMFAPLIYPFEPWRIKHNVHHAHTNK